MPPPAARPGHDGGRPALHDVAVVGGGIVGLAAADALLRRYPGLRLLLLEKEADVARHQTGRNSGVVHAGLYYRPGTLRARLCVAGMSRLRDFCAEHGVAYRQTGKVVVATREEELGRLDALLERGRANGVPGLRLLDARELREIEPHVAGLRAIHSPRTAIVDFPAASRALLARVRGAGGAVRFGARLRAVAEEPGGLRLATDAGTFRASRLLACAGLHADRVARLAGVEPGVRIVPFRGEYLLLRPDRRHLVRGLIYPVPDPALPFLGVHLTRTVHGEVEAGPNAVLAFAREGYGWAAVDARDLADALSYAGFWRLARRHARVGVAETIRSLSLPLFVRSLRRLLPALRPGDVRRGGSGVRAQALDRQGRLLDDFVVAETERTLHVLNAPSPAATAALAIGAHLAERLERWFA